MLYKDSVILTYPNFYTHVAHYAFYVACILRGCDISTGFFIRIYGYGWIWRNHKVVTHPAGSLAQDRQRSQAESSVLTTMLSANYAALRPFDVLHHDRAAALWLK